MRLEALDWTSGRRSVDPGPEGNRDVFERQVGTGSGYVSEHTEETYEPCSDGPIRQYASRQLLDRRVHDWRMDRDWLVGSGFALAAGLQLPVLASTVSSPGPLLSIDSASSVLIALGLAAVAISYLSSGGATTGGLWRWRITAALTAAVLATSGFAAFLALA